MSYNYTSFSFPNSETTFYTGVTIPWVNLKLLVQTENVVYTSYVFKHEIYE